MKCVCSGSVPYSYKELPDGRGRPGASGGSIESPVGGKRRSRKGPSGQPLAAHRTPHRRRWESENHRCGTQYSQAITHPSTSLARSCLTSVIEREALRVSQAASYAGRQPTNQPISLTPLALFASQQGYSNLRMTQAASIETRQLSIANTRTTSGARYVAVCV